MGLVRDPNATDIRVTSALERYNAHEDHRRTAASHHHTIQTVHKPLRDLDSSGQITHAVPTDELNPYRYVWGCTDASLQTKLLQRAVVPIYTRIT
ncbi:hypothetical protein [Streptomyces sp. NPDC007100]|uniref:hypothetical protein n=1 Tax=Streptomyces sp. NPDC007100 TaxID=3155602 RepID=UPI0033C524B6